MDIINQNAIGSQFLQEVGESHIIDNQAAETIITGMPPDSNINTINHFLIFLYTTAFFISSTLKT
jgi:hypothetical protein